MTRKALVIGIVGFLSATVAAQDVPWVLGDVFAGVGNSSYQVYDNNGVLKETIFSGGASAETTGGAFDSNFDLWTTEFQLARVVKYNGLDPHNVLLTIPSAPGAGTESLVFDASGNFYVGHAEGDRDIKKYNSLGVLQTTFNVPTGPRGSDWIDLARDQTTMFYTSEGPLIRRYDLGANAPLPDFANLAGTRTWAFRLLPPFDGTGGLIVATDQNIRRLNGAGGVITTYDAPGEDQWFAMNLDPNGTSFWAAGYLTRNFYRFNIATAAIEVGPIFTGTARLSGLVVRGELTGGNTPPDFNVPPGPQCGSVIGASVGVPVVFTVQASDVNLGDIVTLTVAGLPAGATLVPPLPAMGNPVTTVFNWIPNINQQGNHVIVFTATDRGGLRTQCRLTIAVAECFLLFAPLPANIYLGGSAWLRVLNLNPDSWIPVTMETMPSIRVPNDPGYIGLTVYAQVLMWNPLVFPTDPLKTTNGISATVNGAAASYGTAHGITLNAPQPPRLGEVFSLVLAWQ